MQRGLGQAGLRGDLAEAAALFREEPGIVDFVGWVGDRAADLPSGGLGYSAGVCGAP